ncbi:hypothetical protein B0H16DRAFT_1740264 [Mycena metata]|uniref:Uncharacterized protein n=1 Tax=Mycena metata TaxID=1033252 RepID=A0AAD7HDH5_9AGAR|nr:hypothetical protein B0H16DRAFT_1740264 [Mycena metata]
MENTPSSLPNGADNAPPLNGADNTPPLVGATSGSGAPEPENTPPLVIGSGAPQPTPDVPNPMPDAGSPAATAANNARECARRHQEKAAPGKVSWVWGTKLVFFSKRKDQWLVEAEAGRAGAFYTKLMKLYVKKYGYQLADDEDLEVDIEDPPDSAADEVVHERLAPEEADFRERYTKLLRGRIGQWYRLQYGSLLKSDASAFTEMFTGVLDGAPPKPTRAQIGHYYSRKFYDSRVKPQADARIAALKRRALLEGLPEPKVIDIISKECELALEREYTENVKAWEQSLADSPTRTPDEIAVTLDNAAYYVQPLVDAIQQRFGMCVSLLLCGPIGKRGGRIMVQSVHAGQTKGLAAQKWPEHDWLGFQEVERIMCNFGKECFSVAECRARIVKGSDEEGTGAGASSASVSAGPSQSTAQPPNPAALSAADTAEGSGGAPSRMGVAGGAAQGENEPVRPIASGAGDRALSENAGDKEAAGNSADAERGTGPEGAGHDGVQGGGEGGVEDEYGVGVDAETRAGIEACWRLGIEWGECVDKFFDFECAWGFDEGTFQMGRVKRPVEFGMWLQRGRKWYLPPTISVVGTRDDKESFAGRWWTWYTSLQPPERVMLGTTLSRPEKADWSNMAAMHRTNGLLQVMAALSWWGEKLVKERDGPEWPDWVAAVEDMTWVLEELVDSGEIEAAKEGGKKKRGRTEAGGNQEGANRGGKRQKKNTEKSAEGEAGQASDGNGDRQEQEDESETGKKRKKRSAPEDAPEEPPRRRTRGNPGQKDGAQVLRDRPARGKDQEKAGEKTRPKPRPVNFRRK